MGIGEAFARKRQPLDKPQLPQAVLPKGSWVPFPRNPAFTARDEELLGLVGALLLSEESEHAGSRLAVITGLEGIGKSQLALEFCYRYGAQFERVHWLDCRHGSPSAAQVTQHGQAMQLPAWPDKGADQFNATLQAWKTARQLIVLDHVTAPEHLPDWISQLENSRILITSRQADWPQELAIKAFPLGSLPSQAAVALLRALAPRLRKAKDAELERLAEQLGGLPLALHLASLLIEDRAWSSVKSYQADLEKASSSLPSALQRWTEKRLINKPSSEKSNSQASVLAAAFDLSIRQLEPLAKRVFFTARLCAPEISIPTDLLRGAAGFSPAEQANFELGLEKVYRLGLLTWTEEGPVAQTTLAELANEVEPISGNASGETSPIAITGADSALAKFSEAAARFDYLPYKTKSIRSAYELTLHLEQNAPRAEAAGLKSAGGMWSGLGYMLWVLGEHEQARPCYERALALDEANYGPVDVRIVQEYYHLGHVLYNMCDFKSAKANYQKALSVAEKVYAPDHPEMTGYNNHLGQVLLEIGDFKGAQACFERSLTIHEKSYGFGPKHPEVAIDAGHLGKALEGQGDLKQAKVYYERALAINESVFVYGREHPQVAKDLSNLGRVLRALGDPQNARACFERVVKINEKFFGLDHAETASALNSLGRTLRELGSLSEARACYERVLAIDEKVYGSEHGKTAADLHNMGLVLRGLGDLLGAKSNFERALAIEEKIHWAEHPNVATNVHNLGRVLQDLGDLQGSKACFERALAIDKKIYGAEHPYVATDINNLGSVMQDLRDLEGAKRCFEQALAIDEKSYGTKHPNTARDINNLGSVLKALGDLPAARTAFERALRIFETAYGQDNPKTRVVRENLNGVIRRMG